MKGMTPEIETVRWELSQVQQQHSRLVRALAALETPPGQATQLRHISQTLAGTDNDIETYIDAVAALKVGGGR